MKLRSQLTAPTVAVDRNINNSSLDIISSVNAHIAEIEAIGTTEVLADIATVAGIDFGPVLAGVDTINNLTVTVVETLPSGSVASATLVGSEIQLRIPKGLDGTNGIDGLTPQYEFVYVPSTGNLEYNLIGYIDRDTVLTAVNGIKEW